MEEMVLCPVNGCVVKLENVPDDMFAQKMLGDGLAIQPSQKEWYSPINGVISVIYDTKHAIGITSDQGCEILLHIGLDTYDLKGKPFEMKVKLHDYVQAGDLLMLVDYAYIEKMGYASIAPIISTNKKIHLLKTDGVVNVGDILFQTIE